MMSDVYLCDLPAVGNIFCALDDEMTVSHLLAFLLAVFSIAVPIGIWSIIISEKIYEDPQAWLVKPTNRAYGQTQEFDVIFDHSEIYANHPELIGQRCCHC